MKKYDVIFIHPPRVLKPDFSTLGQFARGAFIFIPMGVFSIADLCQREGFSVKIFNYPLEQYFNRKWDLAKFLKNIDFDVCAIDLHWIHNSYGAIETAKIVKKVNPNAKVVLGGFSASYYYKQILKYCKVIDGVIRGEGEIPFLNYVQNIIHNRPVDSVPNLCYRNSSNHTKINPISYVAESLDDFNFTNGSLLYNANKYFQYSRQIMGLEYNVPIARGCQYNCPCCGGGRNAQILLSARRKTIFRSPEKVVEDLHDILDNYKVDSIFFGHGTYPASLKYWKELFRLIRKEKFDVGADLEIWRLPFPKEMWTLFYKTFARRHSSISISPRTMSRKVQQKVAKICDPTFNFPKNHIEELIKNANLFRITLRIWLTLGYPFQTHADVLNDFIFSMKLLLKYFKSKFKPITIMSEPYYISPGSPAHLAPEKFGIKFKYKSFPEIAYTFKRTKINYGNRVINYDTKHFSRASIRIINLAFFMATIPLFITGSSTETKKELSKKE